MDGFTRTLTKNKGKVFVGAINEYKGTFEGKSQTVAVGFTSTSAYIFKDGEGSFDTSSLEPIIKSNHPDSLYQFDEYAEVASVGGNEDEEMKVIFNDGVLAEFSLGADVKKDIESKLKSLSDFSVAKDVNF